MDNRETTERALLEAALAAVRPLGLHFRILRWDAPRDAGLDAILGLRFGGLNLRYGAEIKRGLRPAVLGAVLHRLRATARTPLLVADYVTPPLADTLREQGLEFIDTAGNAFLNHPPLMVFVKGQKAVEGRADRQRGRAFQATGLQVLFALLARPDLIERPYREIALNAGVAHGTVGWVMAELPRLGYVVKVGGRRRLVNGERLLGQWAEAYARTLRPKLLLQRFAGQLDGIDNRAAHWGEELVIGGEVAAARLTQQLRPGTATFYVHKVNPEMVVRLGLRADTNGNVEFRRRFWGFPGEYPEMAPALLVYADLLATGEARCLETAELLRGQLIDRLV